MVVRLCGVWQEVDEANRDRISNYADIAGKLGAGSVDHAGVRTPRIDCTNARLRIVGLHVLLEFEPERSQITGFYNKILGEFPLHRRVPLDGVAGALIIVNAGGLQTRKRGAHHGRTKHVEVRELRNEIVAVHRLSNVSGKRSRQTEQGIQVVQGVEYTRPNLHDSLGIRGPDDTNARSEVVPVGIGAALGIATLSANEERRLIVRQLVLGKNGLRRRHLRVIDACHLLVFVIHRRSDLVPETEIERYVGCQPDVVLDVSRIGPLAAIDPAWSHDAVCNLR